MKDRNLHTHPSNPLCDKIDGHELEEGDRLEEGDLYAWGPYWWSTWFPGNVIRHDDPVYIRPADTKTQGAP